MLLTKIEASDSLALTEEDVRDWLTSYLSRVDLRRPDQHPTLRLMDQLVYELHQDGELSLAIILAWLGIFRAAGVQGQLVDTMLDIAYKRADLRLACLGIRTCRKCGCTDVDCSGCIEGTGEPCQWVAPDLCSACVGNRGEVGL